jgi:ppGpp synthetase/RelA/SpoT-type nucleotidyltranferase
MNFEEYEREGRAAYSALATTIAKILTAAIDAEEGYRLQQVNERAKQPVSLRKKLEERGIIASTMLENEIKDLAGCRIIFYTNGDVTRFINSGIINQNFEVLETKLHHPGRDIDDATELYISNHYLVTLRTERTAMPEYAPFAGMRCEIQIQTILNHAWAEMAHDTIYKAPALEDFGGREFKGIKERMKKVARKYLLPAGYEFQKIANDFQRLIEGKALFDGDALEAIVEAKDNNVRAEAIETFAENVLPLYDDLQAVYPEIVTRLVEAAARARAMPPIVIETPYGTLPAKTYSDIIMDIADILTRYRYLDIKATFDALCTLYGWAGNEDEQKPILESGKSLAKHQLHVWRQYGPIAQEILVNQIEMFDEDECRRLQPLLTAMLGETLGTEISGTTNNSNTLTLHRGAVVASDMLRSVRTKAIGLLKHQFSLAESDQDRRAILLALQTATRLPLSGGYSNALARLVMDNICAILEFQTEIAPMLSLELLQTTEERVHHIYWRYAELPESMRDDSDLVAARVQVESTALEFRDLVNANSDFEIYKTLVGYNSVFPPAWKSKDFNYDQVKSYRSQQVDVLLASVDNGNADVWFERLSRYAQTKSNDAATFPVFGNFLERLAEAQPDIAFSYLDHLEEPLANFLPGLLAGLMRSRESAKALIRINALLNSGQHIAHIAWYLRFADPFDETLLCRTLEVATKCDNKHAMRNVMIAAVTQFEANPGTLVEGIFLPALHYLKEADDYSWVHMPWFSWLGNPIIRMLDEDQANIVLDALVSYSHLEDSAEYIAAAIAERWPAIVIDFIGKRQEFARTDQVPPRYDAVPFEVYQLQAPLAVAPDIMLNGARTWFDSDPLHFPFDGGRLLASVFPELSNGLQEQLAALITDGNEQDLAFALSVLSAFEGKTCIYDLVRAIVAKLTPENPLLGMAQSVLGESGVVSGEFGFAELHAKRKLLLAAWLTDPSEIVQIFATEQIRNLDRRIAAENRSAEASIALRKLDYGEELEVSEE